jgi:hypothetical protein
MKEALVQVKDLLHISPYDDPTAFAEWLRSGQRCTPRTLARVASSLLRVMR